MKETLIYWGLKGTITIYTKLVMKAKPGKEKAEYMLKMNEIAEGLFETEDPRFIELGRTIVAVNVAVAIDDLETLMA